MGQQLTQAPRPPKSQSALTHKESNSKDPILQQPPPNRPAPSVRIPPEDNNSMTLDQAANVPEILLTQDTTPRRSQRNTPPTTSVEEETAQQARR